MGLEDEVNTVGAMRRYWFAVVLLVLEALIVLAPTTAQAGEQWCEDDPLVVITTPGGAQVPLYVTNAGLGLQHLVAVQSATITYSVVATGNGTNVKMQVTIPGDYYDNRFQTKTSASTGPWGTGVLFADDSGFSGQRMNLSFTLDIP